jgi:Putative esterase
MLRRFTIALLVALSGGLALHAAGPQPGARQSAATRLRFAISFPAARGAAPRDGRIILVVSNNNAQEPRLENDVYNPKTQPSFGIDVDGLKPGQEAVIDASVPGYPLASIADLPAGDYWVQAVFHQYETFHRADGHIVKLPMDRGEGQHWNRAPGNLLNTPVKVHIDARAGGVIRLSLDQEIPPLPQPRDTKYVKYVRIKSDRLTKFWGRPMYLGGIVVLPEGFDEHPGAHYPLMINHGHFPREFRGFPPAAGAVPGGRGGQFFAEWTGPGFPRMIMLLIQHANPYYDDSYAVNSENVGPYGDAINEELIPYVERRFRGLGQGWARGLFGGSTGGWEALASQIFYPDNYNGTWAACPDSIDFRQYEVIDIYKEANAFYIDSDWKKTPHPDGRNYLGHIQATLEEDVRWEQVLGRKTRSGEQWAIWEAVYSPVGKDGYPKPIWDPTTGVIDHEVAAYWREHYDLRYILERDWATLGPKVRGKIHIYVGDMDTWYLNNAVYLMEAFLKKAANPPADAVVEYGDRAEHCWSGHDQAYWFRSLEKRILETAPKGSDLTSWRY